MGFLFLVIFPADLVGLVLDELDESLGKFLDGSAAPTFGFLPVYLGGDFSSSFLDRI